MDKYNLDRRGFLQGLAGAAVMLTGLSDASAEHPPAGTARAGQKKTAIPDIRKYRGLIGALKGFSATIIREHLALLERYRHELSEEESYGSFDQWWVKFRATAMAVRAWGVLGWDNQSRRPVISGLDNDSEWPLGVEPLLVVDMAEHAYVLDFIGQPLAYLDAWLARVNWVVVDSRLARVSE